MQWWIRTRVGWKILFDKVPRFGKKARPAKSEEVSDRRDRAAL